MYVYFLILIALVLPLHCKQKRDVLPKLQGNEHRSEKHHSALLDALMQKMEPRVRPQSGGRPIIVMCDIYVISFGSISEFDMDYTVDIYLRQQWQDSRLAYTGTDHPIILHRNLIDKVWHPDLYFPYEKKASLHNIPVPNRRMRIFPNGTVQYSYRVTLTVSCPMQLSNFPMDRQVCKLIIESFTYESTDVILRWNDVPIGMPRDLELPRFNLTYLKSKACRERHYKTGDYSCLRATFHLRRQFGYYILQTYVPTSMIVMLSWVEFWINKNSEPARVGMGVGTVLTMATQLASTKNSMPRISYPKAIDVWLTCCMFFVYIAMVEYALVNSFTRLENTAKAKAAEAQEEEMQALLQSQNPHVDYGFCTPPPTQHGYQRTDHSQDTQPKVKKNPLPDLSRRLAEKADKYRQKGRPISDSIDYYSRIVFPLSFLLFNLVYWTYYMTGY